MTIEGGTNVTLVGNDSTLLCAVTCDFIPSIQWLDQDMNPISIFGDTVSTGEQFSNGSITYLYLSFDPLKLSHGGVYSCESTVLYPPSTEVANTNIVIQRMLRKEFF